DDSPQGQLRPRDHRRRDRRRRGGPRDPRGRRGREHRDPLRGPARAGVPARAVEGPVDRGGPGPGQPGPRHRRGDGRGAVHLHPRHRAAPLLPPRRHRARRADPVPHRAARDGVRAAPPPRGEDERVAYLRTVGDYRHLRTLAADGARIAVVGGGYIGTEVAAALTRTGAAVTLAHSGARILEHTFPTSITSHLEEVFAGRGVELVDGFRLADVEAGEALTLRGEDGRTLTADAVVL